MGDEEEEAEMTVTVHSTARIILITDEQGNPLTEARVWEGETASGIKIQMLVPRIAAHKDEDLSQFEQELQEQQPPTAYVQAWPLRMVL